KGIDIDEDVVLAARGAGVVVEQDRLHALRDVPCQIARREGPLAPGAASLHGRLLRRGNSGRIARGLQAACRERTGSRSPRGAARMEPEGVALLGRWPSLRYRWTASWPAVSGKAGFAGVSREGEGLVAHAPPLLLTATAAASLLVRDRSGQG